MSGAGRSMMMRINRFLIAGVILALFLVIPALADVNTTKTDDGKLHYTNGTYWITWDRIDDHCIGDRFYINAITNLSPGTVIYYSFFDPSQMCHTRQCVNPETGADGFVTVKKSTVAGKNTISVLINTTGFRANDYRRGDYYIFTFLIYSSDLPDEMYSFPENYGVNGSINLYSDEMYDRCKPTTSPFPVTGTCGALFLASAIILWIRRDGKHADRGETK